MKVSQLQGTPWHKEQLHKTCKDESKYCVYNHKICSCVVNKKNYHKQCVGKGNCEWFEPKTGTPKIYSDKTFKGSSEKNVQKESNKKMENKQVLNEKHQKFLDTAEKRVNTIILKIEGLENLSDKSRYEYTEEEVNKMFGSIEQTLASVKESFTNKSRKRFKF